MRLTACDCPAEYYRRDHRAWWMRIAGSARRLYRCYGCDSVMLIPTENVRRLRQESRFARLAEREAVAL